MIEIRHIDPDDLHEAYNALYHDRSLQHDDDYYYWLVSLLDPVPGRRLLDVSCGEGALLRWARRAGLQVWGADISDRALNIAHTQAPKAHPVASDAQRLPFPDSAFDYVTNIGSLEHYADPEQGAQEMARVLAPDGRAVVLLPNTFGLLWNIRHVRRTGDVYDDGQPIQRYGTRKQWERLLSRNGLHVDRVLPYNKARPRNRRGWLRYLRHPLGLLISLAIWHLIPTNLANCLVFVCSRRS